MDHPAEENTDGSSIKPVSSLRSHFENMLSGNRSPAAAAPPRQPTPELLATPDDRTTMDGQISLDIAREDRASASEPNNHTDYSGTVTATTPRGRSLRAPWSTPKTRPTSMMTFSPPRALTRSPPKVEIHSPKSPTKSPKRSPERPLHSPLPSHPLPRSSMESPTMPLPQSNGTKFFKLPSRNGTPALESKTFLPSTSAVASSIDPRKSGSFDRSRTGASMPPVPPPINRAGKPKIPSKSHSAEPTNRESLAPDPTLDGFGESASPFSTPPSSNEGSIKGELSPPGIPFNSKPRNSAQKEAYFLPSPAHHSIADTLPTSDARTSGFTPSRSNHVRAISDMPQDRPLLPARRDNNNMRRSMALGRPPEPPVRRSLDQHRPPPSFAEADKRPPKRMNTFSSSSTSRTKALVPPKPPPPRNSGEFRRPPQLPVKTQASAPFTYDSDDVDSSSERAAPALTDYPDASQANRRPPIFKEGPAVIPTKYDTKLFAVCGEYICTTGYVTRVWSLLNGELLMSLSHGETVKATAVAFRPAKDVEDEGKRLWLGTNIGEMHEIDIPSHSIAYTKANAHPRCSIVKIFRHAAEMWSLDDEGTIHIWAPDETGSPTLTQTPNTFRIRRGHSFSIVSGSQLWVAFGKEIRVFSRTGDNNYFQQATEGALSQPNVGEVTSGAILSSQPDRVYFGHIDGKVSIYSKKGFNCLGVVSVSLYKISSLVGVGDHLWAGYITGMIYVYDTSCTPWKVMKDWKAHESAIAGIFADRTSIWKLDRLQVASLGTDNMLRIWDGMLKEDWLESQMQQNDSEYCDFREISAVVMTWNAGATKPTALRHNEQDDNFYRELLQPHDPPDILVFGFQELVDLEDKKVTAKSFFRKKKNKDATDNEHMSHQYRAWRDHLIRVVDEQLPHEKYTLLHTANLVGLFTCILVKTSERMQIRDVCAAQVKLGMGGLHGNKGALIVRFFVDDSSLCFINCHLAAGQTQTVHRNNDVATIMEAEALPRNRSPSACADSFVGGGDGSMILDHEICILNGDLNYRIDTMPRNTVIDAVKQGNLAKLLDRDQLLLSRKRNPGFRLRAFVESPINFAPTYKYDVGTDNYDTSDKKRSPAWCDRLLYRGLGRIKQVDYRRHDGVKVSDHRPVSGRFRIRVKTLSAKRQVMAKDRAEVEFEAVKRRIAGDIKLDYLINVFGLDTKEAQRLLKGT